MTSINTRSRSMHTHEVVCRKCGGGILKDAKGNIIKGVRGASLRRIGEKKDGVFEHMGEDACSIVRGVRKIKAKDAKEKANLVKAADVAVGKLKLPSTKEVIAVQSHKNE